MPPRGAILVFISDTSGDPMCPPPGCPQKK
nr:MAG TPA: hypothetical protein [Bacteriophage sp.]